MNLIHLKAFVKVVQTGSFKEAAKHLSVSQPAITQRIQSLEEYLKTKLFSKDADGLSCHGKLLYDRSLEILSLWDQVEEEILGTKVSGRLILGASTIPSEYLLPPFLKSYRNSYPDVKLRLRISGTNEVVRWLRERTVDVAITGEPASASEIMSIPIAEDELCVIAPADSEWLGNLHSFEALMDSDWIIREPQSDTRRSFEGYLEKRGLDLSRLTVSAQLESTEAVIAAVEADLGLSVVSSLAAKRAERLGRVKIISVPDFEVKRSFYCSCLLDQRKQSVISTFIGFLESYSKLFK
ncbi:MAG TPA: selenium metabolism-associated LysR family transcriptional regulator [Bacillota bacterium]|nr:selenium metabolism-associated LysR family transcriptional regulator [Bacillota bacterium]